MACILETACNLVHGNEGRKQFAVLSFHILYKDGVSFVQRFELHGRKRYAAKRLLVEGLVFWEDNFDASSADFSVDMGSLKIVDSAVKNLTADNNMGDIKLTNCDSDVLNLSVDMGSLKINGIDIDKYSSNLSVDLGDIKVNDSTYSHSYTNNAGSGKSINADVNMGDIKINR